MKERRVAINPSHPTPRSAMERPKNRAGSGKQYRGGDAHVEGADGKRVGDVGRCLKNRKSISK